MLEIIALVYLTRKMGELAARKGVSKGNWKLFTVLAWIGAEFIGACVGYIIGGDDSGKALAYVFALGFAVSSYFILKAILSKKPDIDNTGFDFENPVQ